METCLRGHTNLFEVTRGRDAVMRSLSYGLAPYLSSHFVGWPILTIAYFESAICSLQNISRFSLEPGF